jgi:transposase-like protein
MSYFNLEIDPREARSLEHTLNRRYNGAQLFAVKAPDAAGTLKVWATDLDEAREHVLNAMFDLVFNRLRVGAHLENPKCIFCGHKTESRGRNSSGTRGYRCLNPECRRNFVLHRTFRGGVNHPSQSKKPEFARLLLAGTPVAEAADRLGLNHQTAGNWGAQIEALNCEKFAELKCRCGRALRHRGICIHRYTPEGLARMIASVRRSPRRATA